MKELTQEEKEVLFHVIEHMSYYEMMNFLNRTYNTEKELEHGREKLISVFCKLNEDLKII